MKRETQIFIFQFLFDKQNQTIMANKRISWNSVTLICKLGKVGRRWRETDGEKNSNLNSRKALAGNNVGSSAPLSSGAEDRKMMPFY